MAFARWTPFVALAMFCLFSGFFANGETIEIPDLRQARNYGTVSRFIVPREALEDQLDRLGLSGEVQLLSSTWYDSDLYGEVTLVVQSTENLKKELSPELSEQVTIDGTFVILGLPIVASDGSHSIIILSYFTDAPRPFVSPYLTNVDAVRHVESIEVVDHNVTLKNCGDIMHIISEHKEDCCDNAEVGADFDHVTGKDVRISNFPAPFDWGCDILGGDVDFCRRLEPFMKAINDADGDVCTKMSTSKSTRCGADVTVKQMTGVFRDAVPFFSETVPAESFAAEWVDREHGLGIVFPCF